MPYERKVKVPLKVQRRKTELLAGSKEGSIEEITFELGLAGCVALTRMNVPGVGNTYYWKQSKGS